MAREKKLPGYKTNAPAAYKEFKCVFVYEDYERLRAKGGWENGNIR